MPLPSRRRALVAALSIAIALPVASVAVTPSVVAAGCSVKNTRTGATVRSLKTAIKNATKGDKLVVSGTCVGPFTIAKKLTITGKGLSSVLKGGASGPVVAVTKGTTAVLSNLLVNGGKGAPCAEWADFICGGGILNRGKLTIDKVTVSDNNLQSTASRPSVFAGGIYNTYSGTMTITRSFIHDNDVSATGWAQGAGIGNEGTMLIRSSTISGNSTIGTTQSTGAGIYNAGTTTELGHDAIGSLTISNSTISGNSVGTLSTADLYGAGIYNEEVAQTLVLEYVTITENEGARGSGVWSLGPLHMVGALIAGNAGEVAQGPDCVGGDVLTASDTILGHNDSCGISIPGDNNQEVADVKLGPLQTNGGPTRTHALLTGSPAIDAAGSAPCFLFKDQRGVTRPKGDGCDVGAFEKG